MPQNPMDLVLSKAQRLTRSGSEQVALCPAHDDREPSLTIREGKDGRVLLRCQAGCDLEAILGAWGLAKRDLYPEADTPKAEAAKVIDQIYKYTDEHGALLFEAVRYRPKAFRQRQPDGRGGWKWTMDGVRLVLYQLPEVLAAVAEGRTVYVVEGEKDVEAIRAAGGVATCNPAGAGKWTRVPDTAEVFDGAARVVIVADRDDAGHRHARQVRDALEFSVARLEVVEAAHGKDAADHLGAGFTLDQLVPLELEPGASTEAEAAAADGVDIHVDGIGQVVDFSTLFDGEQATGEWLVQPLVPLGSQVSISAHAGTGKSQFSLWMAAGLATGKPLFGVRREPVRQLYVDFEMTAKELASRLEEMGYTDDDAPLLNENLRYVLHPFLDPLDTAPGGAALAEEVRRHQAQVVWADTMAGAVQGDENEADTYRRFARHTRDPLRALGCTVVSLDHLGKDPAKGSRGSSAKVGDVDVAWIMTTSDTGFSLRNTGPGAKNRMQSWVPKVLEVLWTSDPAAGTVGYALPPGSEPGWPAGTAAKAEALDRLGAPIDITKRAAGVLLKAHGEGCKSTLLLAALKFRRDPARFVRSTPVVAAAPPPGPEPQADDDDLL